MNLVEHLPPSEPATLPPIVLTVRELIILVQGITIEFYGSYGGGGYWYQTRGGKLRQWDASASLDPALGKLTGAGWTAWSERGQAIADGYYSDARGRLLIDPDEADKDPMTRGWIEHG